MPIVTKQHVQRTFINVYNENQELFKKGKISGIEARVEFPSQQPHFIRFCVCGKQETKGRERENTHTRLALFLKDTEKISRFF